MGRDRGSALSVAVERLRAQLLAGPAAPDPIAVAERLLAVQGQDSRGVRLAIRARTQRLTVAAVDRALTEDRTLLITWLNRGTLHLVRSEDYPWFHALTTPPLFTPVHTRLRQMGVDVRTGERGVKVIEQALDADGPLTRARLRDRLDSAGIPTKGQALVHLLFLSTLHGVSVRGPMDGRQHAYVLVRDWLGAPPKFDREQALGELARRYLAGYAPADERDLARWAGLPLRDIRMGLKTISRRLHERADCLLELRAGGRDSSAIGDDPPEELPPPRLLGSFDPVLLGWVSRHLVTGPDDAAVIAGGVFRAFAMVGGRAVARWKIDGRRVVLDPFGTISQRDRRALAADGEDVLRYLQI